MPWRALLAGCAAVLVAGCNLFPKRDPLPVVDEPQKPVASDTPRDTWPLPMRPMAVSGATGDVMVVMVHDVIYKRNRKSEWFDCEAENLEKIVKWVVSQGGTFLTMDDLYAHLTEGRPVPEKSVVMTFDDNYQGVYDWALPVLDRYDVPFTVFVHTDFVGSTKGHPKMTWDELRSLVRDHRCTVASHTASHPDDYTKLTAEEQVADLQRASDAIKANLGINTPYLAYANGKYNQDTLVAAEKAGIRMAFLMQSGSAEDSNSILEVARVPFNKFFEYWDVMAAQRALRFTPAGGNLATAPVQEEKVQIRRNEFVALTGGEPRSVIGDHRKTVREFMQETGAVAGVNGGFFALAAVAADDNQMMGPCKTSNQGVFVPSKPEYNVARLRHRPLVVWSRDRYAVVPYVPGEHNRESAVEKILPGFTDCFLAGAWLVVDGRPMGKNAILAHGAQDAEDPRRRAFLGFRDDGAVVCGASLGSVPSSMAAQAAVALGCRTAVLLDSGFSTSLVIGDDILASGHSTKTKPSRPVPHAIMLMGTLAPREPKTIVATEVPAVMVPAVPKRPRNEDAAPKPDKVKPARTPDDTAGPAAAPPDEPAVKPKNERPVKEEEPPSAPGPGLPDTPPAKAKDKGKGG